MNNEQAIAAISGLYASMASAVLDLKITIININLKLNKLTQADHHGT